MAEAVPSLAARRGLPVILACAVVQGWALYGLHHALKGHHWPATDPAWLLGLYAIALFVPVAIQLLAEHADTTAHWVIVAVLAAAYFYFGYYHGGTVSIDVMDRPPESLLPTFLILVVLGLMILPFVQGRLLTGRWRFAYNVLFTKAWRNKLILAEAGLFTGLFWLLLLLWQNLFHLLGIEFFRDLFTDPIFVYPVTSLTLGIALHLIGSIERLTLAILEQLLSVLKWLAVVGGFILTVFTVALLFKLPGLIFAGERAIGALWLLWLVAVIVLLLNAAYRDGSDPHPYPQWIGQSLRIAVPLTVVVSLTALYALGLRAEQYGLTVQRVWAFVVAGSALLYSLGYSWAAFRGGRWMEGMARVNVLAALALIATITLTLTPVLSPYRLAADSQFRQAMLPPPAISAPHHDLESPVHYLRFSAGRYGMEKLRILASIEDHPNAARIRKAAVAALAAKDGRAAPLIDPGEVLSGMVVYPPDRVPDATLRAQLESDLREGKGALAHRDIKGSRVVGIYVDLNGDGTDEFVMVFPNGGEVYGQSNDEWQRVGSLQTGGSRLTWQNVVREVAAGKVSASSSQWKDLSIGNFRLRVMEDGTHVSDGDDISVGAGEGGGP